MKMFIFHLFIYFCWTYYIYYLRYASLDIRNESLKLKFLKCFIFSNQNFSTPSYNKCFCCRKQFFLHVLLTFLFTVIPGNDTAALFIIKMRLLTNINFFYLKLGREKIKFIINKLEGNRDVNVCIFIISEHNSEACLSKYDCC